MSRRSTSPVADCVALATLSAAQLSTLYGRDLKGRLNRLATRKRRAGAILRSNPELADSLRNKTLREVLLETERRSKGLVIEYTESE